MYLSVVISCHSNTNLLIMLGFLAYDAYTTFPCNTK